MPWPSLTAPMPSGLCLAFASLRNAYALPVRTMPLHRGPFRCHAPLRCRLCPAAALQVSTSPMRCDSLRNLACYATQRPSIAGPFMAKAETRLSLPLHYQAKHRRRIAELNFATAVPCQASPLHRGATPLQGFATQCPATALPSLAHASHRPALPSRSAQRRAIPRHCLAGPSNATPMPNVAVSAVPLLCDADFTLPLRRTPRIAAALICITFALHVVAKLCLCLALNALPRRRSTERRHA